MPVNPSRAGDRPCRALRKAVYSKVVPAVLDPTSFRAREDAPVQSGGGNSPPAYDDSGGGSGDDEEGDHDRQRPPTGWVTAASFWYPAHAHIARLRLESSGIPCVLVGEIAAATHLLNIATGGVKLQVPRARLGRALRLLRKQPQEVLPESRVALADFEQPIHAKGAACVVEAAGLRCEVIERRHCASAPIWGRWLPADVRCRLWPAATLVVEREKLRSAVTALLPTPFVRGLTPSARLAHPNRRCRTCDAPAPWAIWHLRWRESPRDGVPRRLLPRLARKCGQCGSDWPC